MLAAGCLDSPRLIDLKLSAALTAQLLHALQMALSATLRSLSLTAAPQRNSALEVNLDPGTVTALQEAWAETLHPGFSIPPTGHRFTGSV